LQPKVSICIPAYKRPENVRRLLQSILEQNFQDFEVVITDDSPDESVKEVVDQYNTLPIVYHKNSPALGTPANWNKGITMAKGEWIKVMHDDDWFATTDALNEFAIATNKRDKFIFSAYYNVLEETAEKQEKRFPQSWRKRITRNPVTLLPRNVIGPPSVCLVHCSIKEQYDTWMKWRVDIDFYIRLLKQERDFTYIDKMLVNVGISKTQVTNFCLNIPEVELPEGLLLLHKYGVKPLRNILVYDAWWRILRNVRVRSRTDLQKYTKGEWPKALLNMANDQSRIPVGLLKIGILSKGFMTLSYLKNFSLLK
jgi:glycosyltransferase involved in cell wall biosynthesis